MRNPGIWIAIALTAAATAAPARAQQVPPAVVRVTLDEARARALEASHRLAEARARESVALAGVAAREAAQLPTVSASAGYTRTNHILEFVVPGPLARPIVVYPDVPDNYRSRIDLQWAVYTGGRTDVLERAARAEASAVTAEIETARADLRLEVSRTFWAVVTARAAVAVLDQALERSGVNVGDARERLNAGLVAPNEVASAEAQQARQRMLLVEARNQRDVAAAELARLVGLDPSQVIEPAADLQRDDTAPPSFDVLTREGLAQRPERKALELRITAADLQRAAAEAGKRPVISVGGGFDYARPNPRSSRASTAGMTRGTPVWASPGRCGTAVASPPTWRRRLGPPRPCARGCVNSTRCWRWKCASARSRLRRASPRWPPPMKPCARRPRRAGSWANGTAPA